MPLAHVAWRRESLCCSSLGLCSCDALFALPCWHSHSSARGSRYASSLACRMVPRNDIPGPLTSLRGLDYKHRVFDFKAYNTALLLPITTVVFSVDAEQFPRQRDFSRFFQEILHTHCTNILCLARIVDKHPHRTRALGPRLAGALAGARLPFTCFREGKRTPSLLSQKKRIRRKNM